MVKTTNKKAAVSEKMTPAERMKKMHAARKAGGKKVAKTKRKPLIVTKPPEGFKPQNIVAQFKVENDGLIGNKVSVGRFLGRYEVGTGFSSIDSEKKENLLQNDVTTVIGLATRLGAAVYKQTKTKFYALSPKERIATENVPLAKRSPENKGARRLPKGAVFGVILRVAKRSNPTERLSVLVRDVLQKAPDSNKWVVLKKEDPVAKLLRKQRESLVPAFSSISLNPTVRELRKLNSKVEEESSVKKPVGKVAKKPVGKVVRGK